MEKFIKAHAHNCVTCRITLHNINKYKQHITWRAQQSKGTKSPEPLQPEVVSCWEYCPDYTVDS